MTTARAMLSVGEISPAWLNGVFEIAAKAARQRPRLRFRIIFFQAFHHRGNFFLRLLSRDARFQERVTFIPACTAVLQFVAGDVEGFLHRYRHPKLLRDADESSVESFPARHR